MIPLGVLGSKRPAPAFDPASIAGMAWWLDAANITASDTDPISTWPDASTASRDATASGVNQPTYRTSILNGLPVVRFDGTNDTMSATYSGPLSGNDGPMTVYVVADKTGGDTVFSASRSTVTSPVHTLAGDASPAYIKTYRRGDDSLSATRTTGTAWSDPGTFDLVSMIFDGTTVTLRKNGADVMTTASLNTNAATFDRLTVGSFRSSSASPVGFWQGDVAALLVYEGAHGTTDRNNIEGYLASRYAITI